MTAEDSMTPGCGISGRRVALMTFSPATLAPWAPSFLTDFECEGNTPIQSLLQLPFFRDRFFRSLLFSHWIGLMTLCVLSPCLFILAKFYIIVFLRNVCCDSPFLFSYFFYTVFFYLSFLPSQKPVTIFPIYILYKNSL